MKTYATTFLTEAPIASAFPEVSLPEIAVVGRSNAGKSTLINTLVGQKHLARVSNRPGRTRSIIFFNWEDRFLLADLPGYGFARVPKEEQERWKLLVESYLKSNRPICGVLALFDIRRKPDPMDLDLIRWFSTYRLAWLPVWTKADKLAKSKQKQRGQELDRLLGNSHPGILSSNKGQQGREALLTWMENRLGETKRKP